jgi:hypothetical protein
MNKRRILPVTFVIFSLLCGCSRPDTGSPPAAKGTPKTFYGQTIDRTKDLSGQLGARDDAVKKQADDMSQE